MSAETLVIRFSSIHNDKVDWLITNALGEVITGPDHEALTVVAKKAVNRRVVVFIPGTDVLLTQVDLPAMNRSQLSKAVPYALEDQLIEDVQILHFAIGKSKPGQPIPVMVMKRDLLQQWIQRLHTAGISPQVILPDFLALPAQENSWYVLIEGNRVWVRGNQGIGFSCDSAHLPLYLSQALQDQNNKPTKLIVNDYNNQSVINWNELPVPVEKIAATPSSFYLLPKQYTEVQDLNLLQGEFRSDINLGDYQKRWRKVGSLAAVCLAVIFIQNIINYNYLSHQQVVLEAQIARVYHSVFPHANSIVDPKGRFERALSQVQTVQDDAGFLSFLSAVGRQVAEVPGSRLQALEYHDGVLQASLAVQNFQQLEKIIKNLQRSGLQVKQEQVDSHGKSIQARLSIHGVVSQ